MNWLAHTLLSRQDIHYRIGNLLADFSREKDLTNVDSRVLLGIDGHRKVDAFTDRHPVIKRSKERLDSKGILRGIAIDLIYDHMLAINWSQYSDTPFHDYLESFYQDLRNRPLSLPEEENDFLNSIVQRKLLNSYQETKGIERAMKRLDARLSDRLKARDTVSRYYPLFLEAFKGIETDFNEFFPELVTYTKSLHNIVSR